MDTDKNIATLEDAAAEAERQELEAKAKPDLGSYTHALKRPVTWEGETCNQLTFQWDKLTGSDHLAIETELTMRGLTLVSPAYTSEFLCRMAARACTTPLPVEVLKKLPLRDFQAICRRARDFLLRAE